MSWYSGKVKLYGRDHKRCTASQATNRDGDTCCPKCKKSDAFFFEEDAVQLGFHGTNMYQEFNWCTRCESGFCIVMMRKAEDYYGV